MNFGEKKTISFGVAKYMSLKLNLYIGWGQSLFSVRKLCLSVCPLWLKNMRRTTEARENNFYHKISLFEL